MDTRLVFARTAVLCLVLALFLSAVAGCSGDEPEERNAFIALLREKVLPQKGVSLPVLAGAEKAAIGRYAEHYALLQSFQATLSGETGKNAGELLVLAEFEDFAALASAEKSLKKAAGEAEKLCNLVDSLKRKTDKKKAELSVPEDLAPAYDAAYAKIVTRPGEATSRMFAAVRATFASILDLLDFINSRSRDMEIDGKNINLKNPALQDELNAKMVAVREKSQALTEAYTEMMRIMMQ
ncbi:MAG: DUF3053 domain-containing protein [Deltaproteobacteria bacterium]|nr:DUF3053 domain-containing protein [Deltaproteobacteria bacterium]